MSDIELDAELLALAGGDDEAGDAIGTLDGTTEQPAQTPTPQPSPAATEDEKPSKPFGARRGLAQKKSSKPARSAVRRRRRDSSEEDVGGEDASDDSLGSGAMDESDSDAGGDLDGSDDDILFPVEGKFRDEKDRKEIMALPEIRREQILAEREEEAMRKRQDIQLKRLLQRQEQDAQRADKKKRKAGSTDFDESPRKSSRARTKQNDALEGFKRHREQALKDREKAADRRRRRTPSASQSEEDAEGESEVEWDDGARKSKDEPAAELHDFERVRVGRSNFAKVCFYPGFEDAIKGCFTRVSVGMDRATGQNVYRMAQIKGFSDGGRPYQIEGQNGKFFWTDQYAVVAHGKAEKEWPFIACSDSKFSEQEFNRYTIAVTNDSLRMPTKSQLQKSLQGIHGLLNRQWTDADIREKLAKQNKLAHMHKAPLAVQSLDSPLNGSPIGTPGGKETLSQSDRLYQLNQQNRKKNLEDIRKAQIAEKKRDNENRIKAAARRAEQARLEAEAAQAKAARDALQVPGSDADDLFGSDISRGGTPQPGHISNITSGFNTPKRVGTPLGRKLLKKEGDKEEKKGLPTFKKRNIDDDLIGAMDLGIDIDI